MPSSNYVNLFGWNNAPLIPLIGPKRVVVIGLSWEARALVSGELTLPMWPCVVFVTYSFPLA
jgi:hypothetical protein